MTQEMLYTGTTTNIVDLIEQCAFPADAFLLVEQLPRQVVTEDGRERLLRFARLSDGVDVAPYTGGRIFTRAFELRWEQEDETTRVVYLGEPRTIPGLQDQQQATVDSAGEKRYYLFGTRLEADDIKDMGIQPARPGETYYAEVRIPRLLRYPLAAKARVQLVVGEYHSPELGQLFRFLDAQPAQDDGE